MADTVMVAEIVTPESSLLDQACQAVVLRTSEGEMTVLPGHTPIVTDVASGAVRINAEDGAEVVAVHGGYMQVETAPGAATGETDPEATASAATSTKVTLLAGIAERAEDIDMERARRAREDAQNKVNDLRAESPRGSGSEEGEAPGERAEELADAEAALARAELRLSVAEEKAS